MLLYSSADHRLQEFFIDNAHPAPETIEQVYDYLRRQPGDPVEKTRQEIKQELNLNVGDDCVGGGGCYWADVDAQARRAELILDQAIAGRKTGEKLAMVLDVDETSLSNYCEMKKEDYGFLSAMFNKWEVSPEADMAVPGTLTLFKKAIAAGIDVFFITGRANEQREATARNLDAAGYKGWKGLSLRVGGQKEMKTADYKSEERKKILDAGYRIVLNVGDQWSDLNGSSRAEVSVKLPNPFYFLP